MIDTAERLLRTGLHNEELSLTLESRIDALGPGSAALREFLKRRGVDERGVYEAELVFEELFTNTLRYGYADPAAHHIEVKLSLSDEHIVMTFDDDARPFDPTTVEAPAPPSSVADLKIGGLGLTLVRKVVTAMQYQRAHGHNHLRVSIPRIDRAPAMDAATPPAPRLASTTLAGPAVDALLAAATIRERCRNVTHAVSAGWSRFFRIDRARLPAAARRVAEVTRRRYPDLTIPYHSRWRHFDAGGVDRRAELERALGCRGQAERARARIDLAVVSVLLDAGAGPAWSYLEEETGQRFTRSEGLAVASFRAFIQGAFAATPDDRLRVDAAALAALDAARLATLFQASQTNPLVGLEGRAALLRRLGTVLTERRASFGDQARPGALFDALTGDGQRHTVGAPAILRALLDGLNAIWPTDSALDGIPLGDAWRHPYAGGSGPTAGWVPFHKLTQWLAYSLFEPLEWAGVTVTDRDELTGLPEYRNGGLLLDTGVLALANEADARLAWDVGSELVVEWRALTVALLDELAPQVRDRLGRPELPLACILEGGTWAAGRELALQLRGGDPPLAINSDGTVF